MKETRRRPAEVSHFPLLLLWPWETSASGEAWEQVLFCFGEGIGSENLYTILAFNLRKKHPISPKELKMKLRRLREKLRRLKTEYKYSDDEEETEKSEMETLKDLKKATEQAIRELQVEAAKADKRKGWFIWKKKTKTKTKKQMICYHAFLMFWFFKAFIFRLNWWPNF